MKIASVLLSTLLLLSASSLAFADAPAELFQSETCTIDATALVQKTKQKVNVTGNDQAYRLTFTDGPLTYKLDLIYSYILSGQTLEELVQTRVASEPGQNTNEKFLTQTAVTYSMPVSGGDMTTQKTTSLYRVTQKDANTVLGHDMNTDSSKRNPDTIQTTKEGAPGVQTITTKSQGAYPPINGIQVLATTLSCNYAPAAEDIMPGTDFYAAVPNAVDQFRGQFNATVQAEQASADCKTGGNSCAQLEAASAAAIQARDDLWNKLFQ
jgi:hypothetical protein